MAWNHVQARSELATAFEREFGRPGSTCELQFAQAVSLGEGQYGRGCYLNAPTGKRICDSNNWGAIHAPDRPPCALGDEFEATDSGEQVCFERWPDPLTGAQGFLRELYKGSKGKRSAVLVEAASGTFDGAVAEMRRTGYFTLALDQYQAGVRRNAAIISKALGEPNCSTRISPWPFLALGIAGAWVLYEHRKRRVSR